MVPSELGVILTAHGSVERLDDLYDFLARIRRGRPAPEELVNEVTRRYRAVGGSPFLRIARDQQRALEERLAVPVVLGMRLSEPSIESAVEKALACGVKTLISLPLAPQSVHVYHEAVRAVLEQRIARGDASPRLVEVPSWGTEPMFVDALARGISDGLAPFPDDEEPRIPVVLTAHSLPMAVIRGGDPYEAQFRAMAEAVIARRKEPARVFRIAFQSKGMGGGEWLGPDLADVLRELATEGHRSVVVAAIGFVADHVETLYDVDIEAKELARSLGMRMQRAPSMNTRDRFVDALEHVARRGMAQAAVE
jgi:protoporphyrin/coproporphyrin ferrochelatase